MKSPLSLCLSLLYHVAAVASRLPRFSVGRLIRAAKISSNFLLKSFTWDALLVLVPGIMGLATGFRMRTDKNAPSYMTIVCYSVTSLPHHAPTALLIFSVGAIFLGVFRFSAISLNSKYTVNYYLGAISLLTIGNLISGLATVISGSKIQQEMEQNTLEQLRNMNEERSPLQLNTRLQEAWDVLQMQFSCCGVHEYRDYTSLPTAKEKQEPLPGSCCAIKWQGEIPQINNRAQCQLDAKLGVRDSIYINMPGCLHPLSAWLKHYLYAQIFVMLISAFSQGLALFYSYVIYYRPLQRLEMHR